MIGHKTAKRIELFEFIAVVLFHVVYAWLFFDHAVACRVSVIALVACVGAALSLYLVKNLICSQTLFMLCILVTTHFIGSQMGSLVLGIFIYMIASALIALIGDRQVNLICFVLINVALIAELLMELDAITGYIPLKYVVMMIFFMEAFLITENFLILTYQKHVDEVEIRNEILKIAQKEKNQFLANMSHEIRTPMNAIIGMSELIMREEDASNKIRENCYNIQSSGEHLLGIINDILDFSKMESGKMNIVDRPYIFASLIQNVVSTASFRKGYKDIELIINCSPKIPTQLSGDEFRIRQILINLINNAIKYTEHGYIYFEIKCQEQDGKNLLCCRIEDTGVGIKEEDMSSLFEAFNRADYLKNHHIEGTGLGLAITKKLVELMGGTIQLVSEYGKGTGVVVEIPQEIVDGTPFLTLKDRENIRIGKFIDKEQYLCNGDDVYSVTATEMFADLGVSATDYHELYGIRKAVEQGEITHLITGISEYQDNREFFEKMTDNVKVYVTNGVDTSFKLPDNVHEIVVPFYSVNVVSALNDEPLYDQFARDKAVKITFQAPEAKVLVVDDNEINLKVANGLLKLFKIDAVLVNSGQMAIDRLAKRDIDIVLMDHMMPNMDGIEAANMIRENFGEYGEALPIIAMTANVMNEAKSMFLGNGFQDFLPKPVTLKNVNNILRKWLPRNKIVFEDDSAFEDITLTPKQFVPVKKVNREELSFVPMEVDEESALENVGGMRDLYRELLECSCEMEEERMTEIQESFDRRDFEEYQIHVHALKGAMRSLGVEELAACAQAQELACKEKRLDDVIAGHAHLMEESRRGHKSIALYLQNMEM